MNKINNNFPDGTQIGEWFFEYDMPRLESFGKQYNLTDHGICSDGKLHTAEIQALIDKAESEGGGVIVVPEGTFMSGALFFKKGVHLYISKGGVLMGSDDIADYPVMETRIEGETCKYFPALINADNADGFTLFGEGTVDGNGWRSWHAFWIRREWNPDCTNKDEQRPRLVYISNSNDVTVAGLTLKNSHYWTNHIYKCNKVKFLRCNILSPAEPFNAPSTDAIDIDVCSDVLVKWCYMSVNDDGVVLKGGKGPWADTDLRNGSNERIIVEDCIFGHSHACMTCGSESIHNKNIIVRRIQMENARRLLWLKFRPDTPQCYEHIRVESAVGKCWIFIDINPWMQFFDLKGRTDKPVSVGKHISMCNCTCDCDTFFNVSKNDEQYKLYDFTFENITVSANTNGFDPDMMQRCVVNNLNVTEK